MALARTFLFTDEKIAQLPLPRSQVEYADTLCRGLRLRVGKSGVRTFIFYGRDEAGKRTRDTIGHWSEKGIGKTFNVDKARARFLDAKGMKAGLGSSTETIGEILDLYEKRGQVSDYTVRQLRKHIDAHTSGLVAADAAPRVLSDLVARVQSGYEDENHRAVGGPATADKVRSGLVSMFQWAQRQGRFPQDRALPTLGLVREDFKGIGWKPRDKVPSHSELRQLFEALGIGDGGEISIDEKVSHRIAKASRLAVLLLMHVPVRSGVGLLTQPASAADLEQKVLRWETHKGERDAELETPLSDVAVEILRQLRALPGGDRWLVPSPEEKTRHIDVKVLSRMLHRLQNPGEDGSPPRIVPDGGRPFTPHCLRALWTTTAGELGIADGVIVRVLGHQPIGASEAQRFYDKSDRSDPQREAVQAVSAELERVRQRKDVAKVVRLADRR